MLNHRDIVSDASPMMATRSTPTQYQTVVSSNFFYVSDVRDNLDSPSGSGLCNSGFRLGGTLRP